MPLPSDCLPLTSSLRDRVSKTFASAAPAPKGNPLGTDELLRYLAKSSDQDASPIDTIGRRASKNNREPELRPVDHATLVWVDKAFKEWESRYPLEPPLKQHIRRLLPLAAAMALADDSFFMPGVHPLHQLLDALQAGAVGWQRRLERAGQMLEQRVERSTERALEWFGNPDTDLSAITRELVAANERDAARAQRMVQRLSETEQARQKTVSAQRDATREINRGLARYPLPSAIGEFITGPWYDSAQLLLTKYGSDSREWDQMLRTTEHLMQSVQNSQEESDADRDRQEQILRHLPSQLRRWLLSLEHDSDAADGAIGLVEYTHLRMQRNQELQLKNIDPIKSDDDEMDDNDYDDDEPLPNGHWYRFEDDEGELRAQLVLQLENGRHLLFANFVGLKALDLARGAFSHRINDGFAAALSCEDTFSISLAGAAGIDSEEALGIFHDPASQDLTLSLTQESSSEATTAPTAQTSGGPLNRELSDLQANTADTLETPEWNLNDTSASSGADASGAGDVQSPASDSSGFSLDPILAPPEGAEFDDSLELELGPSSAPQQVSTPQQSSMPEQGAVPLQASVPQPPLDPQQIEPQQRPVPQPTPAPQQPLAPPPQASAPVPPPVPQAPAASAPIADTRASTPAPSPTPAPVEQSARPTPAVETPPVAPSTDAFTPGGPAITPHATEEISTPPSEVQGTPRAVADSPESVPPITAPAPPPAPSNVPPAPPPPPPAAPAEAAADGERGREIDVPMGAWLGFHDGETPIMAKLAVFDPRRDNYIFVNRKGIAMRELNKAELSALIDQGLVDILETRCYFKDEVERARGGGS